MKRLTLFLVLLVIAGFAFAQEKEQDTVTAAIDKDGVQRVNVVGGEYFFKPNHIIVKVNVPVEMTIKKEPSIVPHDIVIKAPEAGIDIKESLKSDPKVIKFTPTKAGKYPFYCDKKPPLLKSHRNRGMEGVLEVVQ